MGQCLRKLTRRGGHSQWGSLSCNFERTTCYTAEAILHVLRAVFEDRIISRRADAVTPLRSYNLTPLDYYFWDAIKDKCYADKPETIDALKDYIREPIGKILFIIKNWTDRVGYCIASRGSHLHEIIFIINRKDCTFK